MKSQSPLSKAIDLIKSSNHISVFTGAGISVESNIPPFRGEGGLYTKYDPNYFTIDYFLNNTEKAWEILFEIFFENLLSAKPNAAHNCLAKLEEMGLIKSVITQNIDHLHMKAGSKKVYHFHGTIGTLKCLSCPAVFSLKKISFDTLPPLCLDCGGILKPNIVFFGEPIPQLAYQKSIKEAYSADLFIIIGSTGEVMPACRIPSLAKENQCKIIEINIKESNFTNSVTDIFLKGPATEIMNSIYKKVT